MKINFQKLSFLITVSITVSGYSQVRLDQWETKYPTFTSLKSAEAVKPESVYKLSLFGEKADSWNKICSYKKIRGLELIDMFDDQFPMCICNLSELQYLSVRNNKLSALPREVTGLNKLEFLDLYWNENLVDLPDGFEKLSNLRSINIGGNPKVNLNKILLVLAKLPKLKTVYLSFDKIQSLPAEIGLLTQIEELIVDNNLLTDLPAQVSSMKHLKRIVLTNNKFSSLPKVLSTLSAIKEIDLANTYEEDMDKALIGTFGHNKISDSDVNALKKINQMSR
jgi:Leucine-rich repeat (LRR) protein